MNEWLNGYIHSGQATVMDIILTAKDYQQFITHLAFYYVKHVIYSYKKWLDVIILIYQWYNEIQRVEVTFPRAHNCWMVKSWFEPTSIDFSANCS